MALWKSSALFNKDSATLMAASALLLSLEWQGDDDKPVFNRELPVIFTKNMYQVPFEVSSGCV